MNVDPPLFEHPAEEILREPVATVICFLTPPSVLLLFFKCFDTKETLHNLTRTINKDKLLTYKI